MFEYLKNKTAFTIKLKCFVKCIESGRCWKNMVSNVLILLLLLIIIVIVIELKLIYCNVIGKDTKICNAYM